MRSAASGLAAGLLAALALGPACASTPAASPSPDWVEAGCAWEARWHADAATRETRARSCVARLATTPPGAAWLPGPASRSEDPTECLERAWSGVERMRACMSARGYRELDSGRTPYARPDTDARTAAIDARSCAERSFTDTRYGRFANELEWCLARRSWRRAAELR